MGVGHNEASVADVWRARFEGGDEQSGRSVPKFLQTAPHLAQVASSGVGDVLDDDGERLALVDDAQELVPEPGPLPFESGAGAGSGHVLARESTADEVDGGKGKS